MKIDIYTHFLPRKYHDKLIRRTGKPYPMAKANPAIIDLETRFRVMDKYDDYAQVLAPGGPPPEAVASPDEAAELARIANDAMAEVVHDHPDRFVAGVAVIPANNIEAALTEIDRAVNQLHLKGIYLFTPQYLFDGQAPAAPRPENPAATPVKGHTVGDLPSDTKALDSPEFQALFEKMASVDLPIWIHPRTTPAFADYTSEKTSKFRIWQIFGWPYHTTAAMTRLIFSGIFDRFPNIKIVTHHAGAMVPFFENRITAQYDYDEKLFGGELCQHLAKTPVDYFRMFYTDTALNGNVNALRCALSFFGADNMLFGTDAPHDYQLGALSIQDTIASIEQLELTAAEKQAVYEGNARRLLNLRA